MYIFKNILISFFSIIFFTKSALFATSDVTLFTPEGTPQKKATTKSAFADDEPQNSKEELLYEVDAEERGLSAHDLIQIIDQQELPIGVTNLDFHRSILQLKKEDRELVVSHCLKRQSRHVEELERLRLKKEGEENLAPYRFSYVEWYSCIAIQDLQQSGSGITAEEVLHPFLSKTLLLPIARIHIMFYQDLHAKTHHPLAAEAALRYFTERHESRQLRKVQPEDISFVIDIFRHNPNLRDAARMVAKIFARNGAISPVNCLSLYFGNTGISLHTLSGLPRIDSGLIQLADPHEELNAVINDYFRNHVSSIIERHRFGEEAEANIREVLEFFKRQCESVPAPSHANEGRRYNYKRLKNLIWFIQQYNSLSFSQSIFVAYTQDATRNPLNAINEDIMREGYYKESDLLTLCTAADELHENTKTALLTYLGFVSRCFPALRIVEETTLVTDAQ